MSRSPKQQAYLRGVRLSSKIGGITLVQDYFRRWPYPKAVKRLNEKLLQYQQEYIQIEQERNS